MHGATFFEEPINISTREIMYDDVWQETLARYVYANMMRIIHDFARENVCVKIALFTCDVTAGEKTQNFQAQSQCLLTVSRNCH